MKILRLLMVQSLFFFSIFTAKEVKASGELPWKKFENLQCMAEFQKLAEEKTWTKENFRPHVGPSFKIEVFRNISSNIGEWLEVQLEKKNSPVVIEISGHKLTHYSFNKNCEVVSNPLAWPWHLEKVFTTKTPFDWSDVDLKKVVSSGKKGMIYFWSPRFVYSALDLPRMEKLAQKLGYEFIPVVDPRAKTNEVLAALEEVRKTHKGHYSRSLASESKYFRNLSVDLYMRNAFDHFPVTFIYGHKKIHPRWITGIMKDGGVKELAHTFSSELKGGIK